MKVIALGGYSKAGKDYVGTLLKEYYEWLGYNVRIEKFAKPLRTLFTYELVEDKKDKELNFEGILTTPRDLMIAIAYGMKSKYGEDIFAKALINRIKNSNLDIVIITDLRFKIEEELLNNEFKNNLLKIKVYREEEIEDKSQEINNIEFDCFYFNKDNKNISNLIKIINVNLGI